MDLVGGFADFIAKSVFGLSCVARANRLDKGAKIFQALTVPLRRTVGVRQTQAAPAPDTAVENGEHGGERFAFCALEKHFVEIVFCFEHGLRVARVVGFFDDGKRAFEAGDLWIACLFREEAGCEAFENGADGVNVAGFFDGEGADYWAFVGDDGDEAFGLELAKGFANDGAGDAHHGDEFAFDETLAGVEAAGDDGLAELVEDLATKRRGGFGDGRESRRRAK